LSEYIISKTDTFRVIIAGDWNLTLNRIDKQGGQPWKATTYRSAVFDLMDELNLTDIYRQLCADQFESSTSPPATPRAFELLKIGLFKFPPLGARKLFKCPTNYY